MEKREDQELLELQELALNYKVSKSRKSLVEKQMIVKSHLLNHVPIQQLSKEFGVSKMTIYRWISTFADGRAPVRLSKGTSSDVKPNSSIMPKKSQQRFESEADELARLREENRRLAEALKMAEWMNHAKDVMIDEAEKMFNIPIRKKPGAKQ
jgi:transposase-like protein